MHSFLRSVGFSELKSREELKKLQNEILTAPTRRTIIKTGDGIRHLQLERDFAYGIGVAVRGDLDERGVFQLDHYYPYYRSDIVTSTEEVAVNKRMDTDAYTAMCEDMRLGVSLIFYLLNSVDYKRYADRLQDSSFIAPISLSALSAGGKILLGVDQSLREENLRSGAEEKKRDKLIAEARKGNQEAIDSLTIEDMDLYADINRRARKEDIYSIVDTSFVPFGSESDNYSIIGTIQEFEKIINNETQEEMYVLSLSCNELEFPVCINAKDLLGVPENGRRFKGNIWLQGSVEFSGDFPADAEKQD